jgi:predicted RecA/RadA family phage recombinase
MKNYIEKGCTIETVLGADAASGSIVTIGAIAGISVGDRLSGETAVLSLEGVYSVPKVTADVIAKGAKVYVIAGQAGITVGSNVFLGYAFESVGAVAGNIAVLLAR